MSINSYIYLITDAEYIGKNIYKIGRTTQKGDTRKIKRFNNYSKDSIQEFLINVNNHEIVKIEMEIINVFKKKYKLIKGNEWFMGDKQSMIIDMTDIINKYLHVPELKFKYEELIKTDANYCTNCNEIGECYLSDGMYGKCLNCCCIDCGKIYKQCLCDEC